MGTIETLSRARMHGAPAAGFGSRKSPEGSLLSRLGSALDRMLERRRSRFALLELSDEQLKDIGISRGEAYREGIRPFWR